MIRLLLPLAAILIVVIALFTPFSKRVKIALCVGLSIALVIVLWLGSNGHGLNTSRVTPADIQVCGISGEYSYRTNYNLSMCLKNTGNGHVQRLQARFLVETCANGSCQTIDQVEETLNLSIVANSEIQHIENISFTQLKPEQENVRFSAEILQVWASR